MREVVFIGVTLKIKLSKIIIRALKFHIGYISIGHVFFRYGNLAR